MPRHLSQVLLALFVLLLSVSVFSQSDPLYYKEYCEYTKTRAWINPAPGNVLCTQCSGECSQMCADFYGFDNWSGEISRDTEGWSMEWYKPETSPDWQGGGSYWWTDFGQKDGGPNIPSRDYLEENYNPSDAIEGKPVTPSRSNLNDGADSFWLKKLMENSVLVAVSGSAGQIYRHTGFGFELREQGASIVHVNGSPWSGSYSTEPYIITGPPGSPAADEDGQFGLLRPESLQSGPPSDDWDSVCPHLCDIPPSSPSCPDCIDSTNSITPPNNDPDDWEDYGYSNAWLSRNEIQVVSNVLLCHPNRRMTVYRVACENVVEPRNTPWKPNQVKSFEWDYTDHVKIQGVCEACGDGEPDYFCVGGTNEGASCDPFYSCACPGGGECRYNPLAEECDDGPNDPAGSTNGCTDWCTIARCGDGIVQPLGADNSPGGGDDEECEGEGNLDAGGRVCLGCRLTDCGDGSNLSGPGNDPGEDCDDGQINGTNDIPLDGLDDGQCVITPSGLQCVDNTCGDGFLWSSASGGTEECDDGNNESNDGCENCLIQPIVQEPFFCGDSLVNGELAAWFTMENISGNTVDDNSSYGHNGVLGGRDPPNSNGPRIISGVPNRGQVLEFDGQDDNVTTLFRLDQSETSTGATFAAWVYPTDSGGRRQVISTDNIGYDWSLVIENGTWRVFNGNDSGGYNTTISVEEDRWHHVAVVFDPSLNNFTFYLDGVGTTVNGLYFDASSANVRIAANPEGGGGPQTNEFFEGQIDDVYVFYKPLTAGEIGQLKNNSYATQEACDDGNDEQADFCNNSCEFTSCGDGIVQSTNGLGQSEQCDQKTCSNDDSMSCVYDTDCRGGVCSNDNSLSCTSSEDCTGGTCTIATCVNALSDSSNALCRTNCTLQTCGDGVTDAVFGEQCDVDGLCDDNGDGNPPGCNTITATEVCSPYAGSAFCNSVTTSCNRCTFQADNGTCGDSIIDGDGRDNIYGFNAAIGINDDEQCDDGEEASLIDGDGCTSRNNPEGFRCKVESPISLPSAPFDMNMAYSCLPVVENDAGIPFGGPLGTMENSDDTIVWDVYGAVRPKISPEASYSLDFTITQSIDDNGLWSNNPLLINVSNITNGGQLVVIGNPLISYKRDDGTRIPESEVPSWNLLQSAANDDLNVRVEIPSISGSISKITEIRLRFDVNALPPGFCGDNVWDTDGADNIAGNSDDEACDDGGLCTEDNSTFCVSDSDCSAVSGTCTPRSNDGCSSACIVEFCGDTICNNYEACGDCSDDCGTCPIICGNGIEETGETCDDGNTDPGDGCNSVCQLEPVAQPARSSDFRIVSAVVVPRDFIIGSEIDYLKVVVDSPADASNPIDIRFNLSVVNAQTGVTAIFPQSFPFPLVNPREVFGDPNDLDTADDFGNNFYGATSSLPSGSYVIIVDMYEVYEDPLNPGNQSDFFQDSAYVFFTVRPGSPSVPIDEAPLPVVVLVVLVVLGIISRKKK